MFAFKKNSGRIGCVGAALFAGLATGCVSMRPLPPVNLKDPGWTIREGQAIWQTPRKGPELAGEVLLATQPNGRSFVQFTKTPFPFVIAQTTTSPNRWQIEFPTENKYYSGPGKGPARLPWLHLAAALAGQPPPKGWHFQLEPAGHWRFSNPRTGEALEGFFN